MKKQHKKKEIEALRCASCERSIPSNAALRIRGKIYCCPDCAQGKTCDCQ